MFLEPERPAMKGPGHIEGGVAVFEAAVAERHDHLALGHDPAVEIGDAVVGARLVHALLPFALSFRRKAPLPHCGRGWPPRQRRSGEGCRQRTGHLPPPPPPPPPPGGGGLKK